MKRRGKRWRKLWSLLIKYSQISPTEKCKWEKFAYLMVKFFLKVFLTTTSSYTEGAIFIYLRTTSSRFLCLWDYEKVFRKPFKRNSTVDYHSSSRVTSV
ncbi:unnamed protein product, partial [Larinioides sclopetarius]